MLPGRKHLVQLLCSPADNENIKNRAVSVCGDGGGEGGLTLTKRLHFLDRQVI